MDSLTWMYSTESLPFCTRRQILLHLNYESDKMLWTTKSWLYDSVWILEQEEKVSFTPTRLCSGV